MGFNTITVMSPYGARKEALANGAVSPGHQLEYGAASGDVQAHSVAAGVNTRMFACEDELQGRTISEAYADNERVFFLCALPGDEVQARIKSGESIAVGDYLEPAGDGTLREVTTGVPSAVALEASTGGLALVQVL